MLGRVQICLVVMVLVLFSLSCTKIPEWTTKGEGDLAFETLPEKGSIPLKLGNLVSVSINPRSAYIYHLWFQDEDGNLHMVPYDLRTNQLATTERLIPRK